MEAGAESVGRSNGMGIVEEGKALSGGVFQLNACKGIIASSMIVPSMIAPLKRIFLAIGTLPQTPLLHTVDSSLAVEVEIGGLPVTGPGVIRATGSLTRSDSNRLMRAAAVTARVQTSRWLGIA